MPENIKKEIEILLTKKSEKDIAAQLIKINDLFLTQYKLQIDDMEIIPIETEIYYLNEKQNFKDNMVHKYCRQKKHFGQLYFHRFPTRDSINYGQGGVDICISDGEYYLSILIRSAIINDTQILSGPHKIQKKFYENSPSKKERILELEKKPNVLLKRDKYINTSNIFHQKRIESEDYKEGEIYKLNSLNLGEGYKYLDTFKQNFYSNSRKQKIKEEFKQGANYGKESNK
ncbi:MAG: hypothetical protein IKP23_04640 [Elusimicrobiaceae bacterium]|nr:hypothetical protein [Elusimicrobiaceae bacterium]